jgi:DNA polymerase
VRRHLVEAEVSEEFCHLDIESFSEIDIGDCGAYRYAEDPSTFIWCVGFKIGTQPKNFWVCALEWPDDLLDRIRDKMEPGSRIYVGLKCPQELLDWHASGNRFAAHNANFERTMLNGHCGEEIGFPKTRIEDWHCTAAKARVHGLPGDLDGASAALGTHPKDKGGRRIMLMVCRPKKVTKKDPSPMYMPALHLDLFYALALYNLDDVQAEYEVDMAVPDMSPAELEVYRLDQRINDRGMLVDLEAIDNALYLIDKYKVELEARCRAITRNEIDEEDEGLAPTQRDKIAEWIRSKDHGNWPSLENMQAEYIKEIILDPNMPPLVRELLRLYSTYNAKALTKYQVMRDSACADHRIRGMFVHYGAGPGRWSSRGVAWQNMARPAIEDIDAAIELMRHRDLDLFKMFYDHPGVAKTLGSCVRGMIIAPPGKKILALDFAGIESREVAWMFDEPWVIEAFKKFDTIVGHDANGKEVRGGPDMYKLGCSRVMNVPVEQIDKEKRQWGKVIELFGQYEGGVNAFKTFCKTYGVKVDDIVNACWYHLPADTMEQAVRWYEKSGGVEKLTRKQFLAFDCLKRIWRRGRPATVRGWVDIKDAMINAIENPGRVYSIPNKKIMFKVEGRWLYMRLPSGRRIAYFEPSMHYEYRSCPMCKYESQLDTDNPPCPGCEKTPGLSPGSGKVISAKAPAYVGINTKTRQRERVTTYGGRITQNQGEGVPRDLLVHGMFKMEASGSMDLIGSIHDEVLAEVDAEDVGVLERAHDLFVKNLPRWADGLPIAAEGAVTVRYQK